jgi:nitrile hydratase
VNGGQDLGGMMGFGPIAPEQDEPRFHADWEKRVLAVTLSMGATRSWSIDKSRHARENRPPGEYLNLSYYQIWLAGLERLLQDAGYVTADELATGRSRGAPPKPAPRVLKAAEVGALLAGGGPTSRTAGTAPRFKVGDRVRTLNINPVTHTRLPRYLRGHVGEITAVHGAHVFPDSSAHGKGEDPRPLYTVGFTAREIWGKDASPRDRLYADLWEPYLEPA